MPDDQTLLDRFIAYVSPQRAVARAYHREVLSSYASYRGAAATRADRPWFGGAGYGGPRARERVYRESYRSMRDRARDLERNNVIAGAALDRAVENVIGTGIRIRPTSSDPAFNAEVARHWKDWTAGKTADVTHRHTFGHLQRLFYRGKLRDGDCGLLLTEERDSAGVPQPRLQVIEGEWIDTPWGIAPDNSTVDGVELSANDAPAAFWLNTYPDGGSVPEPQRIKARDFVFLSRPALYSSIRGETAFNGGWVLFDQIVGYLEAVVMASRAGASQALVVTKKNPGHALTALAAQGTATNSSGQQQAKYVIEPLTVNILGEGEDVKAFNPTQPQQNMPDAVAAFCRFIGLRFGLTIEQLLLDFSRTNYSSSRAARLQADATAALEQDDFAATFYSRVYPWFVGKCDKAGKFTVPVPADGWSYEWIPQGKPWVDPTKEIAAAREAIALNIDTPENIAMERGYDYAEIVRTNAKNTRQAQDARVAAGLPAAPAEAGQPPPAPAPLAPEAAGMTAAE